MWLTSEFGQKSFHCYKNHKSPRYLKTPLTKEDLNAKPLWSIQLVVFSLISLECKFLFSSHLCVDSSWHLYINLLDIMWPNCKNSLHFILGWLIASISFIDEVDALYNDGWWVNSVIWPTLPWRFQVYKYS